MATLSAVYDRLRDPHPVVIDVMTVLCVASIGVITEFAPQQPGFEPGNATSVVLALGSAVSLLWRRTRPLVVMAICWTTMAVHSIWLFPGAGPFIASLVALYSVGLFGSRRSARVGLAVVLALQPVALVASDDPNADSWGDVVVGAVILIAVWVWGDSRRLRRERLELVEERARRAERERDERARDAVREERSRIAREMHDIVAHSVSVMVVQAGAARRLVELDPGAAAEAAGQVETTGRDALREMRRALGVLRAGSGDEGDQPTLAARLPQPSLHDLAGLVDGYRDAGLDVRLRTDGAARPLPSGIELAAFRIVQEALTNTMKHAGPARAEVRVAFGVDALTIVVADDGHGPGFEPGGEGHGLAGMRERVAAYDGELVVGAHPGGGFRVRARLPLDRAVAPETVRL